jgi:hypothetical protein
MNDLLAHILFYSGGWAFILGFCFGLLTLLAGWLIKKGMKPSPPSP